MARFQSLVIISFTLGSASGLVLGLLGSIGVGLLIAWISIIEFNKVNGTEFKFQDFFEMR